MISLTFILLCWEYDFWFIQVKEELLNTAEIVWKLIIKGHLGQSSAPFPPASQTTP